MMLLTVCPCLFLVGKSLFIKNTVTRSKEVLKNPDLSYVIIRLTQSEIHEEYLTERFLEYQDKPGQQRTRVFHIDVTPAVRTTFTKSHFQTQLHGLFKACFCLRVIIFT